MVVTLSNIFIFVKRKDMTFYGMSEQKARDPHPSTAWGKLNGKTGTFVYYDRTDGIEKDMELPGEFIVVAEWMWVQGFTDQGYWSNEIYSSTDEVMQIRSSSDNKVKFEGTWKDIKDKVKASGLHLWKHIHFIEPGKADIKTIKIKWTAWLTWSNFLDENKFACGNNRIKITGMKEEKNKAIKYFVPQFALGSALTDEDKAQQTKLANVISGWHEHNKISIDELGQEEKPTELPF